MWRTCAEGEKHWEQVSSRRWCVGEVRRISTSTIFCPRSNFWKSIYVQWHKSGRQPSSDYSGDRFPAFATSKTKRAQDRFNAAFKKKYYDESRDNFRMQMWVNCCHSSDCRLLTIGSSGIRYISLHIVIQNFDAAPVTISAETLHLRLKSGTLLQPFGLASAVGAPPARAQPKEGSAPRPRFLCLWHDGRMTNLQAARRTTHVTLRHLDFAVLGDCLFPAPGGARYEPEALESCDQLSILVQRAHPGSKPRASAPSAPSPSAVEGDDSDGRLVCARFDEGKIWRHYSELPGAFWVFNERPDHATF